jgi:hypothetical protein
MCQAGNQRRCSSILTTDFPKKAYLFKYIMFSSQYTALRLLVDAMCQWFMPVISATWEAEIRGIEVPGESWQKSS